MYKGCFQCFFCMFVRCVTTLRLHLYVVVYIVITLRVQECNTFDGAGDFMRKFVLMIGLVLSMSMVSLNHASVGIAQVQAADNMAQVRLILKKLRGSMASMKDFDELEAAGMDKADVDRLRKAMSGKIKQMTTDAVELITAL